MLYHKAIVHSVTIGRDTIVDHYRFVFQYHYLHLSFSTDDKNAVPLPIPTVITAGRTPLCNPIAKRKVYFCIVVLPLAPLFAHPSDDDTLI